MANEGGGQCQWAHNSGRVPVVPVTSNEATRSVRSVARSRPWRAVLRECSQAACHEPRSLRRERLGPQLRRIAPLQRCRRCTDALLPPAHRGRGLERARGPQRRRRERDCANRFGDYFGRRHERRRVDRRGRREHDGADRFVERGRRAYGGAVLRSRRRSGRVRRHTGFRPLFAVALHSRSDGVARSALKSPPIAARSKRFGRARDAQDGKVS
jgi:hypothetical protein